MGQHIQEGSAINKGKGTRLQRRSRRGNRRRLLRGGLFLLSSVLFLVAAFMLISYWREGQAARQTHQALREQLQSAEAQVPETAPPATAVPTEPPILQAEAQPPPTATPRPLPTPGAVIQAKLQSIYAQNRDLVGWLQSDAIYDVDFPIVQRDNSYYLDKDFLGRDNRAGTVFLDEGNSLLPQDQNLILHGHNMKNGTMFGKLHRLMRRETLVSEPFFSFSSLYEDMSYVPYAVSLVSIRYSDPDYMELMRPNFADEAALDGYVQALKAHSVLRLPVDVDKDDRLLTLITCHGEEDHERLVVALRALRPDESRAALRAALVERSTAN